MNAIQFFSALEMGLIYGLVAMAVYLTFRIINFPDLTVDGSFTLGAAVVAVMIVKDVNPFLATGVAVLAGSLAGLMTGYLNVRWKIMGLLASILTMIGLYSINLRIMGQPNISLLNTPTLLSNLENISWILIAIILFVAVMLAWFLASQLGLAMRVAGANARVARAYGTSVGKMTILALMISNGLVAFAGSLFTQMEGFADISMGTGTIIIGLAAVMIGEALIPSRRIIWALLSCVLGSILYRVAIGLALNSNFLGLQASDLNLLTAVVVVLIMIISRLYGRHGSTAS